MTNFPLSTDSKDIKPAEQFSFITGTDHTISDLFELQALARPGAVALDTGDKTLLYAELDEAANRIAWSLIARGIGPEDVVALKLPRGFEMIVAVVGVLKAGACYLPLDPALPIERLEFILKDAKPKATIALTTTSVGLPDGTILLDALDVQRDLAARPTVAPTQTSRATKLSPDNAAYIIYTSGSTGTPKGVVVEHRQVVRLFAAAQRDYGFGPEDCWTLFHSYGFDFSIWEIWGALFYGGRLVIVPEDHTRSMSDFLRLLRNQAVTILNLTPTVFHALDQEMTESAATLPEALRTIILGGEALDTGRLEGWYDRHGSEGPIIANMYGITEACVHVTHCTLDPAAARHGPPGQIGEALLDLEVFVLNDHLEPCGESEIGALYVAGPGLARGYFGRVSLTASRFIAHPMGKPGERLYRTGDLCIWTDSGLVYQGREDDQIKLRGHRIELGEIEARLRAYTDVQHATVLARPEAHGGHSICAFVTTSLRSSDGLEAILRSYCVDYLPSYMVPSLFHFMDTFPLTSNGKLDRVALLEIAGGLGAGAGEAISEVPSGDSEVVLALVAEVLGLVRVGLGDHFFRLGGHSLLATRLVSRIRAQLGRDLPIRAVFEHPVLSDLVIALRSAPRAGLPLKAQDRPTRLPTSAAQTGLWFEEGAGVREGNGSTYVIPLVVEVSGALDIPGLEAALSDLVDRHEALRTLIETEAGVPYQRILAPGAKGPYLAEEVTEATALADRLSDFFGAGFDLAREIPIRARLFVLGPARYVLGLSLHHHAADGWSMRPLLSDLSIAYAARCAGATAVQSLAQMAEATPLEVQPADHMLWRDVVLGQVDDAESPLGRQLAYWQETLSGLPEELPLPRDRARQSTAGPAPAGQILRNLPAPLLKGLSDLGEREGASLYMVLLAGLAGLYRRLGAGDDIPLGVPLAGRTEAALDPLVGLFVNTAVLRMDASGTPNLADLIHRARPICLAAQTHQDLPFERVVEALAPPRRAGRHPLFQTMLALHNQPPSELVLEGLSVAISDPGPQAAKFDLDFAFTPGLEGVLEGRLVYDTHLFDAATAEAIFQRYLRLLEAGVATPERAIDALDLALSGEAEAAQTLARAALEDWPEAPVGKGTGATLTDLLETAGTTHARAVALRPQAGEAGALSHGALHCGANRLARQLLARGIGTEDIVALGLSDTAAMPEAVLAVLKAGAAFLPLPMGAPEARILELLATARPALVLTDTAGAARLPEHAQFLILDEPATAKARATLDDAPLTTTERGPIHPGQAAYVLYTSGSTGAPKGVTIPQGAIAGYVRTLAGILGPETAEMPLFTASTFDLTLTSLFLPLATGGVISPYNPDRPEEALAAIFGVDSRVTAVKLTPSHLALLDALPEGPPPPALRRVILGGEALSAAQLARLAVRLPGVKVLNEYGPTEATIGAVASWVTAADGTRAPIGRPYPGVTAHVLDEALRPCPPGLPGALYLGGPGLARGYLGEPGLTAERFIADPFGASGARFYRTGDRVLWGADGRLRFLGREDDQVKIRGHRVEPGEVEAALAVLDGVAEAVVTAVPGPDGNPRLAAWYRADGRTSAPDPDTLRTALARTLPEALVPDALTPLDHLPLTAHGKLDRAALPAPVFGNTATVYAPTETEEEAQIATLLQALTGHERLGRNDHFFHLGGHSLMAARLVAQLRQKTRRSLSIRAVFETPRIRDLALTLAGITPEDSAEPLTADPAAAGNPFPLSPVQQAYWLGRQDLVALGRVACHAYAELGFHTLDPTRMEAAWRALIARHPMLRARINADGTQEVLPVEVTAACFALRIAEGPAEPFREAMSHQILPLGQWPMFDVRLTRVANDDWRMHLSIDALILDGESTALMLEELFAFYNGEADLETILHTAASGETGTASFRDYLLNRARDPAHDTDRAWWLTRLDDLPPPPALPLARDPETLDDPRFTRLTDRIDPADWAALTARAARVGLTPSIVLLTAYAQTLATWTREATFSLNLTVGDRRRELGAQVENMLGVFTSLVPLGIKDARAAAFETRARRLQRNLAEALDHRAFSGVEVQRLLAQREGETAAGLLPVVFTSLLGEAGFDAAAHGAKIVHAITQTPQTWLDNKVYETATPDGTALTLDWDAPAALFPEGLLDAMFDVYRTFILRLARDETAWSAPPVSLLPEAETQLIAEANNTAAPRPEGLLHSTVLATAAAHPEHIALFHGATCIPYADLVTRIRATAHDLSRALTPEDRLVAVVMEKGPEQIVAALAILAAGRAFLPVSAGQPDARITAILKASGARVVLTQPAIERGRDWQAAATLIDIPAKTPGDAPDTLPPAPEIDQDDLAYVIYTSGSTGAPKGVAISHRAARTTIDDVTRRFNIDQTDRGLWVSSLEFDLSIFDIFGILGKGGSLVIPPPDAARRPECLARLVQDHRVTVWNSVPAIAELMLQAAPEETTLDSLRCVLLSGDWIPLALPDALARAAPKAARIALGGATEAAIWSIFHPIEHIDPDWTSIPYGRPLANQRFHVLNDDLHPCPTHTTGRLYIAGEGLAIEYWNAPDLTAKSFFNHPKTGERLYDTGDLGTRMPNGDIRFLGREDHQIKLRGFRIELEEIEKTIAKHPKIKNAAAIITKKPNKIIAFVTGDTQEKELRTWVDSHLPDYMHPATYVLLEKLPLTQNGKVDRKVLLERATESRTAQDGPSTQAEAMVCAVTADLMGLATVAPSDNFLHLGGDSILAIQLVNRLRAAGGNLRARDVFLTPVLRDIAARVKLSDGPKIPDEPILLLPESIRSATLARFPKAEDVWPLTPLQAGLWYHAHCATETHDPYLVQIRLDLVGFLNKDRLRRALDAVLVRHPGLRVSFETVTSAEVPVQVVHRDLRIEWREYDVSGKATIARNRALTDIEWQDRVERISPSGAPLIRATLVRVALDEHVLLLTQHHLLGDGWSSSILMRDLFELYRNGGDLAVLPPAPSPRAYIAWLVRQDGKTTRAVWRSYLSGLEGPTLVAPNAKTDLLYAQDQIEITLSDRLEQEIVEGTRQLGVTRATIFQAAWGLLLAGLTGRRDVCFGTVNSGRHAPVDGIEDMLGLLLTTTPVRLTLHDGETTAGFMRHLQKKQAELLDAAFTPLTEIHQSLQTSALFDTLFTYENYPLQTNPDPTAEGELPVTTISGQNGNHYPLSIAVIPGEQTLLRLHFTPSIIPQERAKSVLERYLAIVGWLARDHSAPVLNYPTLLDGEARRMLALSQGPKTSIKYQYLSDRISAVAAAQPRALAVQCENEKLNYGQLKARSNQLARMLMARGIGPERLVALRLARSSQFVVAMLGVMKSGAAFLTLDPSDPSDRADGILKDAAPELILGDEGIDLDASEIQAEINAYPPSALDKSECTKPHHPDQTAYVIYTSGSTGRPKGIAVTHRGLPNLAQAQANRLGIEPHSRVAQLSSFSFDAALSEVAMALVRGAALIIAPDLSRVGAPLSAFLSEQKITHATLTPTALSVTPPETSFLQAMIVAGEAVARSHIAPWADVPMIFNAYGPSETTVCATMGQVNTTDDPPPIGGPIDNGAVYVLDDRLQLCPVGQQGALYLAGPGLARGYLGQTALTAERFIASPFGTPGSRMYRTGDLASWEVDGWLRFHGREDNQIKIHGHRIEPAEIEAVLLTSDNIAQATVSTWVGPEGDNRLAAWIAPNPSSKNIAKLRAQFQAQRLAEWVQLEDTVKEQNTPPEDPAFDTKGWTSTFTGQALPDDEMRAYIETTVARIQALKPQRLLEIGCGTGLIMFPLLGNLESYYGVDGSATNIRRLASLQADEAMQNRFPGLKDASFLHADADGLEIVSGQRFDTIILPSVVQYFPDAAYLQRVVDHLIRNLLAPNGSLFFGDVRSLPLMPALKEALYWQQPGNASSLNTEASIGTVDERELALDPGFFHNIRARHPHVRSVQVMPKAMEARNEMSRFRFDAILKTSSAVLKDQTFVWRDAKGSAFVELAGIAAALDTHPAELPILGLKNAWVSQEGPSVADLFEIAREKGYHLDLSMIPGADDGSFDALFRRFSPSLPPVDWVRHARLTKELEHLSNDPLRNELHSEFRRRAANACRESLPQVMQPSSIVVVDELPRLPSGKLDRRNLPPPTLTGTKHSDSQPETPREQLVCDAVAAVLGLNQVGPEDNFLTIGGDSISAIRLVNLLRDKEIEIAPRDVILNPVIRTLAQRATELVSTLPTVSSPSHGPLPDTPMLRWLVKRGGPVDQFRQAILLQGPNDLKLDVLERAVADVLSQHDMLRACLMPDGTIEVMTFDQQAAKRATKVLPSGSSVDAAFETEKLCPTEGDLLRVLVLPDAVEQSARILLVAHHIAVDAVSWPILSEAIARSYDATAAGTPLSIRQVSASFRQWAEDVAADFPRWRSQIHFWKQQGVASQDIEFATPLDPTRDTVATAEHITITLSAEVTESLLSVIAPTARLTPNDIFLSALLVAANTERGGPAAPLRVMLEGHGREMRPGDPDITQTLGWFTALYPLRLDPEDIRQLRPDDASAVIGVLKRIKAQMRAVPDGGLGYGILRWLDPETQGAFAQHRDPDIGWNYLGQVQTGTNGAWQPAPERPGLFGEADSDWPLPHSLAINAMIELTTKGPTFKAILRFAPAALPRNRVESLAQSFIQTLTNLSQSAGHKALSGLAKDELVGLSLTQSTIEDLERRLPKVTDVWPLSGLQEGLAYHARAGGGPDPYQVQMIMDIDGPADPDRLERALQQLLDRHDALRVSLQDTNDLTPVLVVQTDVELPLTISDLSNLDQSDTLNRAARIAKADSEKAFQIDTAPLMRAHLLKLEPERSRLIWSFHHLIADGWSGALLLDELAVLYDQGKHAKLLPAVSMKPALRHRASLDTEDAEAAWSEYLDGFEPPELLSAKGAPRESQLHIPSELVQRIEQVARTEGVTLASLIQAAWALLLQQIFDRGELCIGVVQSGRHEPVPDIQRMVGFLITTTPLRVPNTPEIRFLDLVKRVQQDQARLQPYSFFPLNRIQHMVGGDLFDTLFAYESFDPPTPSGPAQSQYQSLTSVSAKSISHYPIALAVIPGADMNLHLQYKEGVIDGDATLEQLGNLLERISQTPDVSVAALKLLPDDAARQILEDFAGTSQAFEDQTLVALFERQVARTPDKIAITHETRSLSYTELDRDANQMAWALIAAGAGPECSVALCLPRGLTRIVAMIAVLKSGAAYLPIEPDAPIERVVTMLADAAPVAAVCLPEAAANLAPIIFRPGSTETDKTLSEMPATAPRDADRNGPLHPDHPAYIVFTSGSTGLPKGVLTTHRNVARLFTSERLDFDFRPDDIWAMVHDYSFDFAVWELWGPLFSGGRLVIVSRAEALTAEELYATIARESVSVLSMTPSVFARLINERNDPSLPLPPSVRTALVGGEAWAPDRIKGNLQGFELRNVYGPTETTIFASLSGALAPNDVDPPIGWPLANTQAFVLDSRLMPCPIGVTGELYLAGVGLARGYLNRIDLTATRFVAHPFGPSGARIYRTGDHAVWNRDGQLRYRGRADAQIKLRGYRIELGEVEAALSDLPGVVAAVADIRQGPAGSQRNLVAWLQIAAVDQDDLIDTVALRQSLKARLPGYMIPNQFVQVELLPLKSSGKVDRTALPEPTARARDKTAKDADLSPLQGMFCDIVAQLLNIPIPSLNQNFFDLGGDSLLAARLSTAVRIRLDQKLAIDAIFQTPRLADLCEAIGLAPDAETAFAPILKLRAEGKKPPLFCLYPGLGIGWPYANLLSIVPSDRPVIALQPPALSAAGPLAKTFRDIVDTSLAAILSAQGNGPYSLLGWSFGGVVAHAVATKLQNQGAKVENLILFDSYPMPPEAEPDYSDADALWHDLALGAGLEIDPMVRNLNAERIKKQAHADNHLFGKFTVQQLKALRDQLQTNTRLLPTAKLDPFLGDVTLYTAERQTRDLDRSAADPALWSPFVTGRVIRKPIQAEHHKMLSADAIRTIRNLLS